MRTKNAKRLWPVPATLAVVALAAFLAFGLMATTGAQPAAAHTGDAGHCTDGIEYDHNPDVACATTGDSLDVKFTGTMQPEGIWVYTTGVGNIPSSDVTEDVQIAGSADDAVDIGEMGIVIEAQNALDQIQSKTVTVSRSDADDDGEVRLFVFAKSDRQTNELSTDPPTLTTGSSSDGPPFTVTVTFLGRPAAAVDANDDGDFADADDGDVDGSTISATGNGLFNNVIVDTTDEATITVLMKDAHGNVLRGDEDATVDFKATFAEDSDLKRSARLTFSDSEEVSVDGMATFDVDGWTIGAAGGAVKLTVTAAYDGPTGMLTQEIVLSRSGDAANLEVATYNCAATEDPDKAMDGCAATFKPTADTIFTRSDTFVVIGEFTDNLGNDADVASPTVTASGTAALLKADANVPDGAMAQYTVAEDAEFDSYTITVSTGTGDDKVEQELMVVVSGPAENFMLYNPAKYIPAMAGASRKFTIKATDEKNNVPSDSPMVEVLVLGDAVDYFVSGLDSENKVMIEDGEASFEVFALGGAQQGDTVVIIIRVDGMEVERHIATFGANRAPMASAAIADQAIDMGSMAMVQSTLSDPDGQMLSYSAMSDDEMVATAMVDMDGMVTITAVGVGTATITVTATDSEGGMGMQTFMVTVEAADTDTSLQAIPASSISVTNNADSSITVNWMGGDNADRFIVVAAELGSDPFTYELENVADGAARMATISGLNSSSNYIIIVIALQGSNFKYGVSQIVMAN